MAWTWAAEYMLNCMPITTSKLHTKIHRKYSILRTFPSRLMAIYMHKYITKKEIIMFGNCITT